MCEGELGGEISTGGFTCRSAHQNEQDPCTSNPGLDGVRTCGHDSRQVWCYLWSCFRNDARKLVDHPFPERRANVVDYIEASGFWEKAIVRTDNDCILGECVLQEVCREPAGSAGAYKLS